MTEANLIDVVAGVLLADDGRFMLASRPEGKPWAGWWEFPGGKVERGERLRDALVRELEEELAIRVTHCEPWLVREHHYDHASVRLHFYRVRGWEGAITPQEGQRVAWQHPGEVAVEPLLPANGPLLAALSLPEILRITCTAETGVAETLAGLDRLAAPGMVMVREPAMHPDERMAFGREVVARLRGKPGRVVFNGDSGEAMAIGADGVHLTASRLLAANERPAMALVGASVHNREELQAAARLGLDYVVLGHVLATPSHPGESGLGWDGFARVHAEGWPMPLYALGGMNETALAMARAHGAHGIAMMRAAWTC